MFPQCFREFCEAFWSFMGGFIVVLGDLMGSYGLLQRSSWWCAGLRV